MVMTSASLMKAATMLGAVGFACLCLAGTHGCTTDSNGDEGGRGDGGTTAGAGGITSGSGGSGGANQGGTTPASGGAGGGLAGKGVSFTLDTERSDPEATATFADQAIDIVEIQAQAPGLFLMSLVRVSGGFAAGTYSCADGTLISFQVQGTGFAARQGRGQCTVTVTSFSGVGRPVKGTFTATLVSDAGGEKRIEGGTFDVTVTASPN
jgi:hypothetical protein